MTVYTAEIDEGIRVGPGYGFLYGTGVSASDGLSLRTTIASRLRASLSVAEHVRLRGAVIELQATYHMLIAERVSLRSRIVAAVASTIHEHVGLNVRQLVRLATGVHEGIKLSAALAGHAAYRAMATSGVRVQDRLGLAALLALREGLRLTSATSAIRLAVAVMRDSVKLVDATAETLRVVVAMHDTVTLDDDQIVQAVYHGTLFEGVRFFVDYQEPGGGVTTWAMNARTGAISEYQNYDFNSFAASADSYLAASSDGLYELVGESDGDDPIIAAIRNGIMELTGSHLTGLKCAYLAVRGKGDFYLKLEGGGRSTVYKVTAESLKTARINIGKGWRARYLTWELISTGQDFDLTGLEFLPITSTRRV